MLLRLRVSGFKNLVDADIPFGPFTCIAGGNASGKSNLLDAIMFLSALADHPLVEAASYVRDRQGRSTDIEGLFHATGRGRLKQMSFEVEMLVPGGGLDDLGQTAYAKSTFLRYSLALAYRNGNGRELPRPGLQVLEEELTYIKVGDAPKHVLFYSSSDWRRSVLRGSRTAPFLSTEVRNSRRMVRLHQEGRAGVPRDFHADTLPRTVLSTVNAVESPTALLARLEMRAWRLLQLEPSALRATDEFTAPPQIGADGSHMPATLYRMARVGSPDGARIQDAKVYARVSNRLSRLVEEVRSVRVERDERREQFVLIVAMKDGTSHPARALSDGTLRFLALTILEADPEFRGVVCLEEPENGIHPQRIRRMLELLYDMAVDASDAVSDENPLRQVIVTTHSPVVVAQVPNDSVLFAEPQRVVSDGISSTRVHFRPLYDTWRARDPKSNRPVPLGQVLSFLNPLPSEDDAEAVLRRFDSPRVIDREDIGQLSFWASTRRD